MIQKLQNNVLLVIGLLLVAVGYVGPKLTNINLVNNNEINFVIEKPYDPELLELSKPVIEALQGSGDDGKKLAALYHDLSTLISLADEEIIVTTQEIREANSLSGKMLQLNIKDKYPGLAEAANNMVVSYIGDDNILLSDELRAKSVNVFKALSWACNEGSK